METKLFAFISVLLVILLLPPGPAKPFISGLCLISLVLVLFEIKFDKTKDGRNIMWYSINSKRKFIKF